MMKLKTVFMKNGLQLCMFISFFAINMKAQNNANWSIGTEFSIDNVSLSEDKGRGRKNYLITGDSFDGYSIKIDKNNYTVGITADYLIQNKISISSGVLYSNKDLTRTFRCEECDYIGFYPGLPPEKVKQRFLVIPIAINYNFLSGKFKPTINSGFENNFLVKSDLKEDSKSYFLEAFIGTSVYYNFFRKWEAGIGYKYQITLTDLYKGDEFKLRTNSVFFKINYNLK